ncbi:hypothetical protein M407DRAFT_241135 [Tulasnella calospora MUT 4182]|uniref:DNA repair protein SWI5 homolog n=1 Tax=Tulasnella calospora MUT 4182 TaxID=1051891 RepID=A0A0C3QL41_9AGAM|nr:hypothetical protein M407DRAFT_241135 [Tulasnella calospora MUT 4182]
MASDDKSLAKDVKSLQEGIHALENALGGEDPKKIVSQHIRLLHDYNEAKDKAQVLIGRIAALKGVSVKQLHEEYGLDLED